MGKKRKNYYVDKSSLKKRKYANVISLATDACGFLITHDKGREKLCTQNAFRLLNHYADHWYGEYKFNSDDSLDKQAPSMDDNKEKDDESDFDDIDLALAKEVETLQKSVKSKNKDMFRFHKATTKCNHSIFIQSVGFEPSLFMYELVKKLSVVGSNDVATPFILRMHPIDKACKAHLKDITTLAETYISNALNTLWDIVDDKDNLKKEFGIIFRHRFNDTVKRDDVYDIINSVMQDASCEWHFNCRTNKFVLIIEVLRNVCCMGVAYDYLRYKKLNIKELQLSVNLDSADTNFKGNEQVIDDTNNINPQTLIKDDE